MHGGVKTVNRTRCPRCSKQVIGILQSATHDLRGRDCRQNSGHMSRLVSQFNQFACLIPFKMRANLGVIDNGN